MDYIKYSLEFDSGFFFLLYRPLWWAYIFWNNYISVNLLGYSGHIDISISHSSFYTFCYTEFYGSPRVFLGIF